MSTKFPGGFITKNYVAPTPAAAPGIWTLDQQLQAQKTGTWPFGGPFNYIEDVFSTYIYKPAADFTNYSINNGIDLSTKGGMTWFKARDAAQNNLVYDTVRGSSAIAANALVTNNTNAQQTTFFDYVTPNTNGFTVNYAAGGGQLTNSGINFASWTFREQPKFFDVVTWTGDGASSKNIPHALGSVPGCIIAKRTDTAASWVVYHTSLGATDILTLQSTNAAGANPAVWNSTTPTSTQFTVGNSTTVNASSGTYVAYLFAHNAGGFGTTGTDNVISCGSFVSDGSGGCSVTLGYEPQWLLYKNITAAEVWRTEDVMRGWNQTQLKILNPNSTAAEQDFDNNPSYLAPTSTGFNTPTPGLFTPSQTFIYIAIRRGPMKVPTDGTKVFSPNQTSGTTGTPITTGFPVDFQMLGINAGNVYNQRASTRLTGVNTNGTSNSQYLVTSKTLAEGATGSLTLNWNNTGFQVPSLNSGSPIITWNFQRAPSFMDTVCYSGTGAVGNAVSHNLGVAPELIIIKGRAGTIGTNDWQVLSKITASNYVKLVLNATSAELGPYTYANNAGLAAQPTSTTFTVNNVANFNNGSTTYIAHLFATCPGVSKVGSYTGTGASQVINCGFTAGARFVLIKRTDDVGGWYTYDTARGMVTGTDPYLFLNSADAEVNANYVFTSSTGFTIQAAAPAEINASGGSYIFLAIA